VFAFTAGRLTISLLEFRMDTLGIPVVQVLQDHQAPAPRTGGLTHVPRRLIGVSQMLKNPSLVIPITQLADETEGVLIAVDRSRVLAQLHPGLNQ